MKSWLDGLLRLAALLFLVGSVVSQDTQPNPYTYVGPPPQGSVMPLQLSSHHTNNWPNLIATLAPSPPPPQGHHNEYLKEDGGHIEIKPWGNEHPAAPKTYSSGNEVPRAADAEHEPIMGHHHEEHKDKPLDKSQMEGTLEKSETIGQKQSNEAAGDHVLLTNDITQEGAKVQPEAEDTLKAPAAKHSADALSSTIADHHNRLSEVERKVKHLTDYGGQIPELAQNGNNTGILNGTQDGLQLPSSSFVPQVQTTNDTAHQDIPQAHHKRLSDIESKVENLTNHQDNIMQLAQHAHNTAMLAHQAANQKNGNNQTMTPMENFPSSTQENTSIFHQILQNEQLKKLVEQGVNGNQTLMIPIMQVTNENGYQSKDIQEGEGRFLKNNKNEGHMHQVFPFFNINDSLRRLKTSKTPNEGQAGVSKDKGDPFLFQKEFFEQDSQDSSITSNKTQSEGPEKDDELSENQLSEKGNQETSMTSIKVKTASEDLNPQKGNQITSEKSKQDSQKPSATLTDTQSATTELGTVINTKGNEAKDETQEETFVHKSFEHPDSMTQETNESRENEAAENTEVDGTTNFIQQEKQDNGSREDTDSTSQSKDDTSTEEPSNMEEMSTSPMALMPTTPASVPTNADTQSDPKKDSQPLEDRTSTKEPSNVEETSTTHMTSLPTFQDSQPSTDETSTKETSNTEQTITSPMTVMPTPQVFLIHSLRPQYAPKFDPKKDVQPSTDETSTKEPSNMEQTITSPMTVMPTTQGSLIPKFDPKKDQPSTDDTSTKEPSNMEQTITSPMTLMPTTQAFLIHSLIPQYTPKFHPKKDVQPDDRLNGVQKKTVKLTQHQDQTLGLTKQTHNRENPNWMEPKFFRPNWNGPKWKEPSYEYIGEKSTSHITSIPTKPTLKPDSLDTVPISADHHNRLSDVENKIVLLTKNQDKILDLTKQAHNRAVLAHKISVDDRRQATTTTKATPIKAPLTPVTPSWNVHEWMGPHGHQAEKTLGAPLTTQTPQTPAPSRWMGFSEGDKLSVASTTPKADVSKSNKGHASPASTTHSRKQSTGVAGEAGGLSLDGSSEGFSFDELGKLKEKLYAKGKIRNMNWLIENHGKQTIILLR